MNARADLVLETATDILRFDARTGALCSLRRKSVPDQEFIAGPQLPALVIQYLDPQRQFRQWRSGQAEHTRIEQVGDEVQMRFSKIAGRDLEAVLRVRGGPDQRFSRWSLRLTNHTGLQITDVQFPMVVSLYHLRAPGSEAVLWPSTPAPRSRRPNPRIWPRLPAHLADAPENSDVIHYPPGSPSSWPITTTRPGSSGCQDSAGRIKLIRLGALRAGPAPGYGPRGDWPTQGERRSNTRWCWAASPGTGTPPLNSIATGAASSPGARQPLHQRRDVPGWLLDSPPHVILRSRASWISPTLPNEEFLPNPKMILLLKTRRPDRGSAGAGDHVLGAARP